MPYRLATPHRINKKYGAGDKFRTCYLQSHNLALYRLSYARHISGAPGETRTPDTRLRRPLLYPAELRAHKHSVARFKHLERVMGIGPTQPAWKASVLPLNYTRTEQANCSPLQLNAKKLYQIGFLLSTYFKRVLLQIYQKKKGELRYRLVALSADTLDKLRYDKSGKLRYDN